MTSTAGRRPRSDAAHNRDRVLTAAEELFNSQGTAVHMSEVAKSAGVGVGTVYRHFPTRRALVEAVAEQRFVEILAFAREHCLDQPDPREALRGFLHHVGEVHERGRGQSDAIEAVLGSTEPRGEPGERLQEVGETLLRRGREAHVVRADITVADLYMIVGCVATICRNGFGDWRRFVEIALNGFRPLD
ncbi:TetR/AcrR family transcriptional regulator [Stackebrandtia nassauensis]|uniref:Transcriptional regulator, TetR family n=1 Tax=Stackebrandtia nassauensis (strain DSM 44728 / CIP 108903 / NRRL B-16338 / NBRC 102104 / LLR-40K-21) TaxID=446470 RepID=D3Q305_STANL|nr:TetR/AcrR family transcriptional regulator [Stackebrandtia nassauensis]ADD39975.1 transcriptional regulator, TetR family [Stackebrandtia nassauensis DSM 44728]